MLCKRDSTLFGFDRQSGLAGGAMDVKKYLELQEKEIQRHKWIESEKAGRDLGFEAVIDWIQRYADQFSDAYLRNGKAS